MTLQSRILFTNLPVGCLISGSCDRQPADRYLLVSNTDFSALTIPLVVVLMTAHLVGYAFSVARQPRVIGEILAGLLLGPAVLGRLWPSVAAWIFPPEASPMGPQYANVIGFLSNLGLLLLMFASGAESRGLFTRADRREVAWLGFVGTGLPFVLTIVAAPLIPIGELTGTAQQPVALLLVVAIAVAVTSIPVISRIFHDLGLLNTRFARLVLSVAVVEDTVLWAILAVATSLATGAALGIRGVFAHITAVVLFFGGGLTIAPSLVRALAAARWNAVQRHSPVAFVAMTLLAYASVAGIVSVSLAFAAFLAGYATAAAPELRSGTDALNRVAFGVFIPIYFAGVGYDLDLTHDLAIGFAITFIALACAAKLVSALAGARFARFRWRDSFNLAVALNARGGPGIVLATVALDAGIINSKFFTTLIALAIVTSMAAGAWLDRVVRSGAPLLVEDE